MSVFRVHKTQDYTVLSNHHFRNKRLSLKARGLLGTMLSLPDTWDYSIAGLSEICLEGPSAIGSAIKELERERYVKRTPIRSARGTIVCWDYDIYEQPYTKPPSPEPDIKNPASDKPHLENPHLDNRPQLNTKEVNTNKLNTYKSNTTWQAFENQPLHQRIPDYSYAEGEVL